MTMENLPLEVIEVIVTYLSAEELTQCLGVSCTWYNIFSNDMFWKKHLIGNLSEYLTKTKCLVEPIYKPPKETLLPLQGNRLQFLQEKQLLKNWDSGHFIMKEIVFDCDDSISYNIRVSFLDNDHICLHRTYETEVWNVAGTPFSVMTITYCLKDLWQLNVYEVSENNLVVIQCNLVQIYKISLDSKSWCLNQVFFYDKPEPFSSSITPETNIESLFQLQSIEDEVDFERVICGDYLVGASKTSPFLHVWNIKTGKKIKEDICETCKGKLVDKLKAGKKTTNVLVIFKASNIRESHDSCSIVYDLTRLQFLPPTLCYHSSRVFYFDGYMSVVRDKSLKIVKYCNTSNEDETEIKVISLPASFRFSNYVHSIRNNLLIYDSKSIFLVCKSKAIIQNLDTPVKVDFNLSSLHILLDRYVLLHAIEYQSIKEVWKMNKSLRKIVEFPADSGTYIARNDMCSKIVLEQGNKLIVLNFW